MQPIPWQSQLAELHDSLSPTSRARSPGLDRAGAARSDSIPVRELFEGPGEDPRASPFEGCSSVSEVSVDESFIPSTPEEKRLALLVRPLPVSLKLRVSRP